MTFKDQFREGTLSPTLSNRLRQSWIFAYNFCSNLTIGISSTFVLEYHLHFILEFDFRLQVFQLLENRLLEDCNFAYMFLKSWNLGYCSAGKIYSLLKICLNFSIFSNYLVGRYPFSHPFILQLNPDLRRRRSAHLCPVNRGFPME